MKKVEKILISIAIIVLFISTVSFAESEIGVLEKTEEYKKWESLSKEEKENTIEPQMYSVELKDSVKRSKYNLLLRSYGSVESNYNLKNDISNITVKDQKKAGFCWAFAFSSVVETSLQKQQNKISVYSPAHIAYKVADMFYKDVDTGGNSYLSVAYATSGNGPVLESEMPFESIYTGTGVVSATSVGSLNKNVKTKINETVNFPNIYKNYQNGSIIFYTDGTSEKTYTSTEVNEIRALVKEHIKTYGAVASSMYADFASDSNGIYYSEYYNNTNASFYCNEPSADANHMITIVGWDDNYSKENFKNTRKPANNGAYIVLNSYGSGFGNSGYMYISYDDVCIEEVINGIKEIKEFDSKLNYDKLYQYDELGVSQAITGGSTLYAANKFSRDTTIAKDEYINEIGLNMLETEGIRVFLNPESDNLDNDNMQLVASPGTLESGYHVVKLATPIKLTGDKFAVKVEYTNAEGSSAPLEVNLKDSNFTTEDNYFNKAVGHEGESFISMDGNRWSDVNGLVLGSGGIVLKNTNTCIKAFTTYQDIVPATIAVTGVTLDKNTMTIKEGATESLAATVLPINATNKNITWQSEDEQIATASNGVVTGVKEGTTSVNVITEDGNKIASCNITVEKNSIAVTGVTLDKNQITIKEGETESLTATVLPTDATNKNIIWQSEDEQIATVSNGVVSGVKEGTTKVNVITEDGNKIASCNITVEKVIVNTTVSVTGVTLDKNTMTIKEGATEGLVATVLPTDATNKNIIWQSEDEQIATVSNGVVSGVREGTTKVNVITEDGNKIASCNITIEKIIIDTTVSVTGVTLDKNQLTIKKGTTGSLIATILPTNATNKNITWQSEDEQIATVSNGIVNGIKEGTTKINVLTEDGNKIASCNVTVEENQNIISVEYVKLNLNTLTMQVDDTTNLVVTFNSNDVTNKNVKWSSSDESIATVDKNGIIRAIKDGMVTITVTTEDGNKIASCKVTVKARTNTDDDIYVTEKAEQLSTNNKADTTSSTTILPKTGKNTFIIIVILLIAGLGIVKFIKIIKCKDIK